MKIKNTKLSVIQGDITELEADAIVCPANIDLTMEKGLANAIKVRGGTEIELAAMLRAPIASGEAIITPGCHLSAKHVIHAVTVDENGKATEESIRGAAAQAIQLAEENTLHSLAFPALGCGVGKFPQVGAAKIITQEILKLRRKKSSSLHEIIFCLFDDKTFQTFDKTISGYVDHIQNELGLEPYTTVDIIIELEEGVVLIERSNPPFGWALPGGFLDAGESLEEAAYREAKEETSLDLEDLRQFHTYSKLGRDPRFQTISTVFTATGVGTPQFGDDAKGLQVIPYAELLSREYAFDHKQIISEYLAQRAVSCK